MSFMCPNKTTQYMDIHLRWLHQHSRGSILIIAISQPELLLRKWLDIRLLKEQAPGSIPKTGGRRLVLDSYILF